MDDDDPVPLKVENVVNNNEGDNTDKCNNERDEFLNQPVDESETLDLELEEGSSMENGKEAEGLDLDVEGNSQERDKTKKKEGLDVEENIGKGSKKKTKSVSNGELAKSREESGKNHITLDFMKQRF